VGNRLTSAATTGNTTQKNVGGQIQKYIYDVDNRLIEVRDGSDALIAAYTYDPFGRGIRKDVAGTITYYLYSDEGLIGEYNATGAEIKTYGYKPNSTWTMDTVFMQQGDQFYFYHNDHLGTPQKMTDASGTVVWSATYDAFGKATVDGASTITNNLRFPGQYLDGETGWHYNGQRFYNPGMGRYVTEDPLGYAGGDENLYTYVKNNQINVSDHWGLCPGDRKKCMDEYIRTNYGGFIAETLVPSFSLGSYVPGSDNFPSALKTSLESLLIKGGILVGIGGAGTYLISEGYSIMAKPASDFGKIFGLYGRAKASAAAIQRGLFLRASATLLSEAVVIGGTAATAFATTAELLAYIHCKDQEK